MVNGDRQYVISLVVDTVITVQYVVADSEERYVISVRVGPESFH